MWPALSSIESIQAMRPRSWCGEYADSLGKRKQRPLFETTYLAQKRGARKAESGVWGLSGSRRGERSPQNGDLKGKWESLAGRILARFRASPGQFRFHKSKGEWSPRSNHSPVYISRLYGVLWTHWVRNEFDHSASRSKLMTFSSPSLTSAVSPDVLAEPYFMGTKTFGGGACSGSRSAGGSSTALITTL